MADDARYLTYAPWQGQLNNTRLCFETAVVLAYISGRVLVLPRSYRRMGEPEWQNNEFRPLHPAEVFDLGDLARNVTMISEQQYARGTQDGWRHGVYDILIEPGTTVFCHPDIPEPNTADADRLVAFAAGRDALLWLTPELQKCRTLNLQNSTLEPFYAFFYFSRREDASACKDLVRNHIRFQRHILVAGEWIAQSIGDFAAMHVRRGDFFWQRPDQNLPAEQILRSLERAGVHSPRVYIASDETNRRFFDPIAQHYETFFIEDFRGGLIDGMSDEQIACVEQVVCSLANVFVGTRLSTFSSYITRLRGYRGSPDLGVYFTDGAAGSEVDDDGSPEFSWENWLRQGHPLWGREYREGWWY